MLAWAAIGNLCTALVLNLRVTCGAYGDFATGGALVKVEVLTAALWAAFFRPRLIRHCQRSGCAAPFL